VAREPQLIINRTRGNVVCSRLTIADRPFTRMRGLLGRDSLAEGEGLLLKPAPSIHTAFMKFAIDAVFMDRNMRVLKIAERLSPWHTARAAHARCVLEMAAGEAARRGVELGDELEARPLTVISSEAQPADQQRSGAHDPGSVPARVLLVGSDRRFLSLAAALLGRRGCVVTVGDRPGAAEQARRERAEVVVLDASSSPVAAAREAGLIEALSPPVGVVVVGDRDDVLSRQVLSKWGSFERLCLAIERARPRRAEGPASIRGLPAPTDW
jgi:uncharacterized membrane protein (UPF0127 family)